MERFTVSPQARRDLIDIWKYIARDSIRNADRVYERFYEAFAHLGSRQWGRHPTTSSQTREDFRWGITSSITGSDKTAFRFCTSSTASGTSGRR